MCCLHFDAFRTYIEMFLTVDISDMIIQCFQEYLFMTSFKTYNLFRLAFFVYLTLIFYSNALSSYIIPFQKLQTNSIFVSQKMKLIKVWIVLFKYSNRINCNLSVVFRTYIVRRWRCNIISNLLILILFRKCISYQNQKYDILIGKCGNSILI